MNKTCILLTGAVVAGVIVAGLPTTALASNPDPASTPGVAAARTSQPEPVSLRLSGLTGTHAEITVTGVAGARVTLSKDGVVISEGRILNANGEVAITGPVKKGDTAVFSATQTVIDGDQSNTSTPTDLRVASDITEVEPPTVVEVFDVDFNRVPVRVNGRPGATVSITNSLGDNALESEAKIGATGTTVVVVSFRRATGPTTGRFSVSQSYGGVTSSATAFHKDDQAPLPTADLTAPRVTSTVEHGFVHLHANAGTEAATGILHITGVDGNTISNATFSSSGNADAWFSAPTNETIYTTTVRKRVDATNVESAATRVVVNEGVGQPIPDAPVVDGVQKTASRAAVTVSGQPGSQVTIVDVSGATVAIKRMGATAKSVQIPLTLTGRADKKLLVTQSIDGVVSDPAALDLETK